MTEEWTWAHFGSHPEPPRLLAEFQTSPPSVVAVDVETISLKERIAIGIGMAPSPNDAFYFRTFPEVSPEIPWHVMKNPDIAKLMHNAMFDLSALREFDLGITNIRDTSVMAHLLGYPPQLATLAGLLLLWEIQTVKDILPKKATMLDLDPAVVARKCCDDTKATFAVYNEMLPYVDLEYYLTECQLLPILEQMAIQGIAIDQEVRDGLELSLQSEVDYYIKLAEAEGFNPASNQQVGYILATRDNWLPFTRTKKSLSVSKDVLKGLDDPLAALVLNYRSAAKALNTYLRPLDGQDRAYTHWHLDAITGRISSTQRNLQNMDRRLRCMFTPDSGMFTDMDYSQIELRVLAHVSQDREMLHIYESGGDIHTNTALFMNIARRLAKGVNFAMIFGATAQTIMETAGIRDRRKAEALLYDWFMQYREAGDWIQMQQERGLQEGTITTIFNRKIVLPTTISENEWAIRRKAVNYVIQGSAAEIIKRAMIKCAHLPMILQIHDSLLFDGEIELPDSLEHIAEFHTPIEVKVVERWE